MKSTVTILADKCKKEILWFFNLPDARPVSVTTSHPDHASYKLFVISHADSFFLLLICKEKLSYILVCVSAI